MSTLAGLWNEEGNWCNSVLTVLAAGNTGVPTANIQPGQSLTVARSPRIEIEVEEVGQASEQMAQDQNGQWYFSHRFAMIRTELITGRTITAQVHGNMRGRIRYLLSRAAQTLVSPAVTYYQTVDVQELGSNVYVRDSEQSREDVTMFRHRIEYGILPSSVPTA